MGIQIISAAWILLLLVSSCSPRADETEHSFRIYKENGVTIAETTGGPKYAGELFQYEKVVELYQDQDRPESLLNRPGSFFLDEDGKFYIEDNRNHRIAVFNPTGRYESSIGRSGSGPGEFSRGWNLLDLSNGVLTTYDYMLRRTTLFRTDGTLLEIISNPTYVYGGSIYYNGVDSLFIILEDPYEIGESIAKVGAGFLTVTADQDTLGMARTPLIPNQYLMVIPWADPLNQRMWMPMPYAPQPNAQYVADRGVLLSTGAEPTIWWYRLDGTVTGKVSLDLPVQTISQQEKDDYLKRIDNRIEQSEGMAKESAKLQRRSIKFPDTKAYWTDITVDDGGYIWLQIPESEEEKERLGSSFPYYVLNPEGEYLGTTRVPALGQIRRGHLLTIVTDTETDAQIPTVYRILPAFEGLRYP